jgi:hypothetical protein
MRKCSHCGLESDELVCPMCGTRLFTLKPSAHTVRLIGLAILIPFLVWLAMTSLFGW